MARPPEDDQGSSQAYFSDEQGCSFLPRVLAGRFSYQHRSALIWTAPVIAYATHFLSLFLSRGKLLTLINIRQDLTHCHLLLQLFLLLFSRAVCTSSWHLCEGRESDLTDRPCLTDSLGVLEGAGLVSESLSSSLALALGSSTGRGRKAFGCSASFGAGLGKSGAGAFGEVKPAEASGQMKSYAD